MQVGAVGGGGIGVYGLSGACTGLAVGPAARAVVELA